MKIVREDYSKDTKFRIGVLEREISDFFNEIDEYEWDDAYYELIAYIEDIRYEYMNGEKYE